MQITVIVRLPRGPKLYGRVTCRMTAAVSYHCITADMKTVLAPCDTGNGNTRVRVFTFQYAPEDVLQIFTGGRLSSNHLRATCKYCNNVWLASYRWLQGDMQIFTGGRLSSNYLNATCKYSLEGDIKVINWGQSVNSVLITFDLPVITQWRPKIFTRWVL